MSKNRFEAIIEPEIKEDIKAVAKAQKWTVYHQLKNKLANISNGQFKQLVAMQKITLTGRYMNVTIEEIERRVWVDALITLTDAEIAQLEASSLKEDIEEDKNGNMA